MTTKPFYAVLGISLACSLLSLSLLYTHPHETGAWRTSLNVLSLVLVVFATAGIARARRVR